MVKASHSTKHTFIFKVPAQDTLPQARWPLWKGQLLGWSTGMSKTFLRCPCPPVKLSAGQRGKTSVPALNYNEWMSLCLPLPFHLEIQSSYFQADVWYLLHARLVRRLHCNCFPAENDGQGVTLGPIPAHYHLASESKDSPAQLPPGQLGTTGDPGEGK